MQLPASRLRHRSPANDRSKQPLIAGRAHMGFFVYRIDGLCYDCRTMRPNRQKDALAGGFRNAMARFGGNGLAAVIVFLLILPKAPSVLCIAPGSHIAIERMNASCCSKPVISHQNVSSHENGLVAAGDCHNCTDYFIESDGKSAVPDSFRCLGQDRSESATRENYISADTSSLMCWLHSSENPGEGCAIASPPPLRC